MSSSSSSSTQSRSRQFFSAVKYLDLFSGGVNLNVGGHSVFRTAYGSIFTIAYLGIMIYIIMSAIDRYFDKTKPLAVGEIYSTNHVPEINLFDNKLQPVLVAYSNETDFINAENISKYFTIQTQKIIWEAVTNPKTNEAILVKSKEIIPAVPCKQLNASQLRNYEYMGQNSFYFQTLQSYGICSLLPKNTTVKGSISDDYFTQFVLKVLPCSLPSGCASEEEMFRVNFQLILPTSNLDVSNPEHPHEFTIRTDEVYYVTPNLRQIYLGKLKQFSVHDYEGIVPTWETEKTVYDIGSVSSALSPRRPNLNCTAAQVQIMDNLDCLPYFEFQLQSSGLKVTNKRTYVTLSQTLSTIGGTNSVVIVVMLLLYGPINEKKRKEYMTRKIYSLIGVKEEDLQKGLEYLDKRKSRARMTLNDGESPEKPLDTEGNEVAQEKIVIKSERRWWRCCCCKKKSEWDIELEKRVKRAHQRIYDSLDVMTIVKNFNQLKVLTHFFFEQRHFDLSQYVGFDLWQAEVDEKERLKAESEDNPEQQNSQRDIAQERRNLRKVRMSHRILTEKQRFNQWMDFIRHKHNNRPIVDKVPVKSEVSDELDEFYFQKLYPNHGLKTTEGMIDLVNQLMRFEVDPGDVPSVEANDRNQVYTKRRKSTGLARPDVVTDDHNEIELAYRDEDHSGQHKPNAESFRGGFGGGLGGLFNNILSQGLPEQQGENATLKQSGMTEGHHNMPSRYNPES